MLFITASIIRADEFPPKGFTEVRREKSPQEDFQMIYFRKEPDEIMTESQIWIQASKPSSVKTQLLFEYSDDARCVVSDDEQFIAVNKHIMAGFNDLTIFVRMEDGRYEKEEVDILNASIKMMAKQLKLKKLNSVRDFESIRCSALAWLEDGLVLCDLGGSAGHSYFDWYFIFDAKKNEFLLDLSKVNRRFQFAK